VHRILTRGSPKLEVREYLRMLRRNWILVAVFTMVGLSAGGLASILVKPSYTADTQLFVAIQGSGSVQELAQGNTFSQARVQSYVKTVTTPTVLQPVIDSLGLQMTPGQLAGKVKATSDVNTVIVTVSVTDGSPVQAAAIAKAIASNLVETVEDLEKPKNGESSPVKLSVISPATAPTSASAPNTKVNLLLGLLIGLGLGVGIALIRAKFDTKVRGEIEVRKVTSAPILGGLSFDPESSQRPLLTQTPSQGGRAESFRQLRTNLQFARVGQKSKTVLISSSLPGEGKTTTAINLAISMAQTGQTVALVDADLRRPMVSEYLGLERHLGLTTVLVGDAETNDLLQPWGDGGLYVLASGQIPPNPSELLGSQAMGDLVAHLEDIFDAVIIDAPPLLPVTDAAVLAQHAGGVLIVVGSQKTRVGELERSIDALEKVSANVLGVVLNRLPTRGPDSYSYSYGSYSRSDVAASTRRPARIPEQAKSFSRRNTFEADYGNNTESDQAAFRVSDRRG